ncbi:hypothetical protein DFH09DRAFT_1369653, partial [Mycena vulgaris]
MFSLLRLRAPLALRALRSPFTLVSRAPLRALSTEVPAAAAAGKSKGPTYKICGARATSRASANSRWCVLRAGRRATSAKSARTPTPRASRRLRRTPSSASAAASPGTPCPRAPSPQNATPASSPATSRKTAPPSPLPWRRPRPRPPPLPHKRTSRSAVVGAPVESRAIQKTRHPCYSAATSYRYPTYTLSSCSCAQMQIQLRACGIHH